MWIETNEIVNQVVAFEIAMSGLDKLDSWSLPFIYAVKYWI